jgi:hypothetical protein
MLPRVMSVRGSSRAERLDGFAHGDTQRLAMVFAVAHNDLVTLSIRSRPRADVDKEVERIVQSLGGPAGNRK